MVAGPVSKHGGAVRRVARRLAVLLGLLCTGPLAAGAAGLAAQEGGSRVGLPLGTPAPDAVVEDLDGNPVHLLDVIGGRPALIEFWASWCENCEALQPQLDRIEAVYGDRVQVVAVAVAVAQSLRRVRRHVEDHDPGYPYLWDARGAAVRAYEAPTTSVVVMIDAEGRIAYTGVGPGQDLIGSIRRILPAPGS